MAVAPRAVARLGASVAVAVIAVAIVVPAVLVGPTIIAETVEGMRRLRTMAARVARDVAAKDGRASIRVITTASRARTS
jgi:hypothetical protein